MLFSSPNMNFASCLASSVFPTPVGPAKMKLPIGRFGSFIPDRLFRTALRDGVNRLVLADDRAVQFGLHIEQTLGLVFADLLERHAGHLGNDLGDHLLIDDAVRLLGLVAPVLRELVLLLLELLGLVAQVRGLLEVLLHHRGFLLGVELVDLLVDVLQVRRPRHRLEANARPGLVDHVDGLVRQAMAGDVPLGKFDRRLEGRVGDLHAVVRLVPVAQTLAESPPFPPSTAD